MYVLGDLVAAKLVGSGTVNFAGWTVELRTRDEHNIQQLAGTQVVGQDGEFSFDLSDDVSRDPTTPLLVVARMPTGDVGGELAVTFATLATLQKNSLRLRIDIGSASPEFSSEASHVRLSGAVVSVSNSGAQPLQQRSIGSDQPGDNVDIGPGTIPTPPPPLSIHGRLVVPSNVDVLANFTGYQVVVSYTTLTDIAFFTDIDPNFVPSNPSPQLEAVASPHLQRSTVLTDPSQFALVLNPRPHAEAVLSVVARYPDGSFAAQRNIAPIAWGTEIVLEVAPYNPPVLLLNPAAAVVTPRRIRGKVLDLAGKRRFAGAQVVLWSTEGGVSTPVFMAFADGAGNFAGDAPKGTFSQAIGTISGTNAERPEHGVVVALAANAFPDFVYLAIDGGASTEEDDCGCHTNTPRQPDQADLVHNSSSYSQDIGAGCVNFTTPNRTLEESSFYLAVRTTEPEIKGTTLSDQERRGATVQVPNSSANSSQRSGASSIDMGSADILAFKTVAGRGPLTAANSVDWDSTPTFYQATTIAHGHLLHFKQEWKADGYSMGDLLYSLPLAPGQQKNIVVFDWDRTESASRSESSSVDESLNAYLNHSRDVSDIVSMAVHESSSGHSDSKNKGIGGGLGIGGGGQFKKGFFGVSGGFAASSGSASTNSSQNSSRDLSASSLNHLRDNIQQAAAAVRNQRATVVQTARQAERFRVETETVANYNHCHAITVQYFEILRHYAIVQSLADVQECLFVPLLMARFDEAKVMRWREALRAELGYRRERSVFARGTGGLAWRDNDLAEGFEAIDRRAGNYIGVDFPAGRYADEPVLDLFGELTITLNLNRPRDNADTDATINEQNWAPFVSLHRRRLTASFIFNNFFSKRTAPDRDHIFEKEIAPPIAEGFVDQLLVGAIDANGVWRPLPLDLTLMGRYQNGQPLNVSIRPKTGAFPVRRSDIERIVLYSNFDLSASANSRVMVNSVSLRYRTAHFSGVLIHDNKINNDLKSAPITVPGNPTNSDNVVLYTPLTADELRNPRVEDAQKSQKLLAHLNANMERYHSAIWMGMDPNRRYMLLDGFVAPNSGGRSVASVVENRIIGIAGNCMIMPVARGYKLDPSYNLAPLLDGNGAPVLGPDGKPIIAEVNLLDHYQPRTPVPPFRISVPTRGVFAEAVQGACNSCEKIDDSRYWRWEEHPIPNAPTQIQPIGVTQPQPTTPANMTPTPFPSPIVNIQNAPNAPEPGAGLSEGLAVLGKSDLFRDITGTAATQAAALQAMLSNQESAKHFADKAAALAIQASNIRNSGATVDQIKQAVGDGTLDKATGQKLVADTLRARIDGGKAPSDGITASSSDLGKATADAVRAGNTVSGSQSFADGTTATVAQTSPGAAGSITYNFTVKGVPPLKQPNDNACWAAATAMMMLWNKPDGQVGTGSNVVAETIYKLPTDFGIDFGALLDSGAPLMRPAKAALLDAAGLVADANGLPDNEAGTYDHLLKTYGPLWVTVDTAPGPDIAAHAKVIYGIFGDGTQSGTFLRIIDPRTGTGVQQDLASFRDEYDALARDQTLARQELSIRLVRFDASGEGGGLGGAIGTLTKFARAVSMSLSADRAAKLAAIPGGTLTMTLTDSDGWAGKVAVASEDSESGITVKELTYPVEMVHNGRPMVMPMVVVESMKWDHVSVWRPEATQPDSLPLNRKYALAASRESGKTITMVEDGTPLFPLARDIQSASTIVFGWRLGAAGEIEPLDLASADAAKVEAWFKGGTSTSATSTSDRVVFAVFDLTLCAPDDRYSPKSAIPKVPGAALVARFFPLFSVWSSHPLDMVSAELTIQRPSHSIMGDMWNGGEITPSLYTDANHALRTIWDEMSALQKGFLVSRLGALSAPWMIAAMKSVESPRWDNLFAHYKLNPPQNTDMIVVDPNLRIRMSPSLRFAKQDLNDEYQATQVVKLARQGMYDNVHISPSMAYESKRVYMAPICHHDCLHMHWRWGAAFSERYLSGWDNGLPYVKAGAPHIPENQTLRISFTGKQLTYAPTATSVSPQQWQIFMHHGAGYVTALTELGETIPLMEAIDLSMPAFNGFYYHNRMLDSSTSAPDQSRLDESKFADLEAL